MPETLEELRQREVHAAEAGDVEALLALRTDDFVAMPPGHPPVRGTQDVRVFLEGMFSAISIRETVTSETVVQSSRPRPSAPFGRCRTLLPLVARVGSAP